MSLLFLKVYSHWCHLAVRLRFLLVVWYCEVGQHVHIQSLQLHCWAHFVVNFFHFQFPLIHRFSVGVTIRLINKCYKSFAAAFLNICSLVGFILLPRSKMSNQFFFQFTWKWYSVLSGYNDEYLFHACASFSLSGGFKLNRNS